MKVPTDSSKALCPAADDKGPKSASWPPGFRFHPTDEELVLYYLKRKICKRRIKLDVIRETDVYKWDPEELPGQAILKTGDRQWFFFTPRDRKYPNGSRSSRATSNGYWKATGKDRNITCNSRSVGVKKTLVFYRGRAPVGERTDWVMHEYTMDEQELSRCQNAQDYYALYKLYKKSGPGPKNGEQYGAPFQEEEWAEDDYVDVFQYLEQGVPAKQLVKATSPEDSRLNSDMQSSLDALETFMNRLADEPELVENQADDHLTLPQVAEEEAQSILVEPSSKVVTPEPINVCHKSVEPCSLPASFGATESPTSQLQLCETSEISSAADSCKHKAHTCEDFLEIDDLIEIDVSDQVENLPTGEVDGNGMSDYDLFHDAEMFISNLGFVEQGVPYQYVNTLDNDNQLNNQSYTGNQLHCPLQPCDMATNLNYQLQPDMVDQSNYHFQPYSNVSNEIDSQLWLHDESEVANLLESNQVAPSLPIPGVVNESANLPMEAMSGPSGEEFVGTKTGYSSALWAFVDSMPTTPASAAESALVNWSFERISSLRITARTAKVDSNWARRAGRSKGFIFFSVLGAACAISWVLIGPPRLWGGCTSA